MTTDMLISVIVPTCRRNDLLAKCLDRLAPGVQTLPPDRYEVIVTDDGPRRAAEQMVREGYAWARWVEGPRRGPAANRNRAAAAALGEWLAFTDDDCLPAPDWLASYAEAVTGAASVYEGKTVCLGGVTSPLYQAPVNLSGGLLWSCNFMIRASLFAGVGGFDADFTLPAMEDIDLHERLSQAGHQSKFVEGAVVDHPPRRMDSGLKTGKMYEAKVQYWNKRGRYGHSFVAYMKHLKHHMHRMWRFGFHRDILFALCALLVEALYVIPRLPLWERKYRARHRAARVKA